MKFLIDSFQKLKINSKSIIKEIKSTCTFNLCKQDLKHNEDPKFQKTDCYDINDKEKNKNKYTFIKIEKHDPSMILLSDNQKIVLNNYINKSLYDYHKGTIHIEEISLQSYRSVQHSIENNSTISKSCVDFVLADMNNSYNREGYINKQEHTDEEYFEVRNK